MQKQEAALIEWLFATRALCVAPADQPFWYTSGTLGPYYINTHFLFGGAERAGELLDLIDKWSAEPLRLPTVLHEQVINQYAADKRYRQLMDIIAGTLRNQPFDFISGGARRDFFFSVCAAALLKKPHVSLFKNGSLVCSDAAGRNSRMLQHNELAGQRALHVADLVTEASSYTRAWLPGLRGQGASVDRTLAVVDRNQNGRAILAAEGVRLISLVTIEPRLFQLAAEAGIIDSAQRVQVNGFIEDPHQYMITFLAEHPGFLEKQVKLGGQKRERALRCLELGYGQKS